MQDYHLQTSHTALGRLKMPLLSQQTSIAHLKPILCAAVCCNSAIADEAVAKYVPGPVEVGPEIWVGAIAATIPFVIGSWEFAKRIVRCLDVLAVLSTFSMQNIDQPRCLSARAEVHRKLPAVWDCVLCRSYRGDARSARAVAW